VKKLDLTHDALKFLDTLQAKQYRQVVQKVLSLLSEHQPADSRQLKGYPFWRVDIGEFRIVYRFDDSTVNVEAIGKRNDDEVYRKLGRT
jgi:mRNA interferase RelE/StbE